MKLSHWISREKAMADVFLYLSLCYHSPNDELAETVEGLGHSLQVMCREAVPFVHKMKAELETGDLERIRVDHARLFVGPFQLLAPPYGSVYLDGTRQVMGPSTFQVMEAYRAAGVEVSGTFLEPADHLAAELEFVHYLLFLSLKSAAESDLDQVRALREQALRFLERHVGSWVDAFTVLVETHATTNFYRNLAWTTRAVVRRGIQGGLVAETQECERETI